MNRRPAGTSSGGEFAPKSHSEADVSLTPARTGIPFGEDLVDSLRKRIRNVEVVGVDEHRAPDTLGPDEPPRTFISISDPDEDGQFTVEATSEGWADCPRCSPSSGGHDGCPRCGRHNTPPSAFVILYEDDDSSAVADRVEDLSGSLIEQVDEDLEDRRGAAQGRAEDLLYETIERLRSGEADLDDFGGGVSEPGVSAHVADDGSVQIVSWAHGPGPDEIIRVSEVWEPNARD